MLDCVRKPSILCQRGKRGGGVLKIYASSENAGGREKGEVRGGGENCLFLLFFFLFPFYTFGGRKMGSWINAPITAPRSDNQHSYPGGQERKEEKSYESPEESWKWSFKNLLGIVIVEKNLENRFLRYIT